MRKTIATVGMLCIALSAGSAQADPVAGWDFSQYGADGQLTLDGTSFTNTLDANYSSLVPGGAGAAASVYGTMFANSSFGSSTIDPTPGSSPLSPTAGINACDRTPAGGPVSDPDPEGCTAPNIDGPIRSNKTAAGESAFDAHSALTDQGQAYTSLLGLTADSPTSLVFQADLSKVNGGTNWAFSLGARTFSGSATVGVDFAPNCGAYAPAASLSVTTDDEVHAVSLPAGLATTGCVRVNLPTAASGQAIIDNVVIEATPVPEPGVLVGLAAGLGWLWTTQRRRTRS